MIATERLPASFGVLVDLDLTRPFSDHTAATLRDLMRRHGLLLFRGRTLDGAAQIRALEMFGRVSCDGAGRKLEMHVSNTRPSSAPQGELIFHYDYAYDPDTIGFISLYGEDVAVGATPTLFASSARPLDDMPAELRRRIDHLTALQACFLDRAAPAAERALMTAECLKRGAPGWGAKDWRCIHPLVRTNKDMVESLFVCLQHTARIMELSLADSDALLQELFGRLYAPANVYTHAWRTGDLVIWDNITVQHCRPPPNGVPRTLRRYEVSDIDLTEQYLAVGRASGFV